MGQENYDEPTWLGSDWGQGGASSNLASPTKTIHSVRPRSVQSNNPSTVRAMLEDYGAGLHVDRCWYLLRAVGVRVSVLYLPLYGLVNGLQLSQFPPPVCSPHPDQFIARCLTNLSNLIVPDIEVVHALPGYAVDRIQDPTTP
jgi:hypothetical protein